MERIKERKERRNKVKEKERGKKKLLQLTQIKKVIQH